MLFGLSGKQEVFATYGLAWRLKCLAAFSLFLSKMTGSIGSQPRLHSATSSLAA